MARPGSKSAQSHPLRRCAVAAREGLNLVTISVCTGPLLVTSRFAGTPESLPTVEVIGLTYTVLFQSGFFVRATVTPDGASMRV